MSAPVPAQPIADAILAKLTTDLPTSYKVCDAVGPLTPSTACPYVVLYADAGTPEGEPMVLNRSLTGSFSVRAVGLTPDQSRRGGDRVRASLHGAAFAAGGRRIYCYQTSANSVERDDAAGPPTLFEHLLLFGFRSD